MKQLKILALMQHNCVPPENAETASDKEMAPWKMEYDVMVTLGAMGHKVQPLGVEDELKPLRDAISLFKPDIVFNMLEEFRGDDAYVPYVLGWLELVRQPYTGCNPRGMILASSKMLQKKILRHHRVLAPDFAVFPRGRAVRRPPRLKFPLFVKSATKHGSVGISQASVVHDDDKLKERVEFIFDQVGSDAMAEEYIDGRELYVGLLGNERVQTFPIWEMHMENLPDGAPRIATFKTKWDYRYQEKVGVRTEEARDIEPAMAQKIVRACKRAYRALGQSGYARIDLRLMADGRVFLIESNPNPQLAFGEDFAESAEAAGLSYEALLQKIISAGLRYHAGLE